MKGLIIRGINFSLPRRDTSRIVNCQGTWRASINQRSIQGITNEVSTGHHKSLHRSGTGERKERPIDRTRGATFNKIAVLKIRESRNRSGVSIDEGCSSESTKCRRSSLTGRRRSSSDRSFARTTKNQAVSRSFSSATHDHFLACTRPDTLFTVSTWRHAPTHRARHLPKSTESRRSFLIVGRGIPDSPTPQCPCPCRSAERRAAGTIVDQILSPPGNRSLPFKRLCFRPIYPFDHRLLQSWRFLRNPA